MVRPLFIPAFWPRPHPFQVQIVPVSDVSQLVWLLCVAVTLLKFPRTAVITEYTGNQPVDYLRLAWFYRRLSQIGHPGAIQVSLSNIERLAPCFANVCSYLASVQAIDPDDWRRIGRALLQLFETDLVKTSEFFRLSLLSLFSRNAHIDHFAEL